MGKNFIIIYKILYHLLILTLNFNSTLRKNSDIWLKWTPTNGNHLYLLQLKIAKRAAELLEKNGLMVYSTCSFNPVENEVVLLNLLRQSEGALELVDVEDKLEHLKHVNGLEKWALMQKNLKVVNSFEEVDENSRSQLRPVNFKVRLLMKAFD